MSAIYTTANNAKFTAEGVYSNDRVTHSQHAKINFTDKQLNY